MNIDVETLREWLAAMREFGVTELKYEDDDTELRLKRGAATAAPAAAAAAPAVTEETVEPDVPDEKIVKSPVVGVFYASNVQDGPPLVKVGDEVHEGDVLAIIEAMKLMNEVLALESGKVKEILVHSGQKVEYGQPLMILE